jgi:hypothetical protein
MERLLASLIPTVVTSSGEISRHVSIAPPDGASESRLAELRAHCAEVVRLVLGRRTGSAATAITRELNAIVEITGEVPRSSWNSCE